MAKVENPKPSPPHETPEEAIHRPKGRPGRREDRQRIGHCIENVVRQQITHVMLHTLVEPQHDLLALRCGRQALGQHVAGDRVRSRRTVVPFEVVLLDP